jgi:hypothetical protein
MEQDDLTPAARELLINADRLKAERLEAARAKSDKLIADIEARGTANDERER